MSLVLWYIESLDAGASSSAKKIEGPAFRQPATPRRKVMPNLWYQEAAHVRAQCNGERTQRHSAKVGAFDTATGQYET